MKTKVELGVELELDAVNGAPLPTSYRVLLQQNYQNLLYRIKDDCSLCGGCEMEFLHPTMRGWNLKDIAPLLKVCKEKYKLTEKFGNAGMHVHLSVPNMRRLEHNFTANVPALKTIFHTIGARPVSVFRWDWSYRCQAHWGIDDWYRSTGHGYNGTIEIRAFNATTNPRIFKARLIFCKYVAEYFDETSDMTLFWDLMPKFVKHAWKYLVLTDNPHNYGMGKEQALEMIK